VKPMKMAPSSQRFHLPVHVATLGAVAFVHEHVEAPVHAGRFALKVGYIKLMDERAQQARRDGPKLLDKLRPRSDARRRSLRSDDPGVLHHAHDLLIQFVAVRDDKDAGVRIVLQKPLGDQAP